MHPASLNSVKFQEKHSFVWKVNSKVIESFKDYANGMRFSSPIFNNIYINCFPNGDSAVYKAIFQWALSFASFPTNINKMEFKVTVKTNLCSERKEYNFQYNPCNAGKDWMYWCL